MLIDFNIKQKIKELKKAGKKIPKPYFDLGVAFWLIDPEGVNYVSDSKKTNQENYEFVAAKLKEFGLEKVFYEIEMPVLEILADMEVRGVMAEVKVLTGLKKELDKEIEEAVVKIYKIAGREFNLNSPKQLGEILFDVLKIKPKRKTKTGARSTGAESLEAMKDEHEIIELILKYRELFKLNSTYVIPLSQIVEASKDKRIHTTFLQTGTATGRLSSENPNIQNIPTGTEYAKKIRSAFVPKKDCVFLSLDYSQIELRVMASVSGDPNMIEAFKKDIDIHALTASRVFNVPIEQVTKDMRHHAKTLNFGVIYGMGPQAFARATGFTFEQAFQFIEEYFREFYEVKIWQDKLIDKLKQTGYVENLNGRKRWLPGILSPNQRVYSEATRAAINMPIQGLAADIIKLAMIEVKKQFPDIGLILSIHDELVFEVPSVMLKDVAPRIKNIMEGAYELKVPLKVDVLVGKNWAEVS